MRRTPTVDTAITRIQTQHFCLEKKTDAHTAVTRLLNPSDLRNNELTDDSDNTRIAVVHPETGRELPALPASYGTGDDDHTIIQMSDRPLFTAPGQFRTEHIPDTHATANDDDTVLWNARAHNVQRIRKWLRLHRVRVVIVSVVMSIAVLALFISRRAHTDNRPESEQIGQTHKSKRHRNADTAQHAETRRCTLNEAVTWLINGDYKNARAGYRFLSRKHPADRSYTITLRILETQEEYK